MAEFSVESNGVTLYVDPISIRYLTGAEVDFGPFGSTGRVAEESMPDVVAAITRAAFANGATHVTIHVASAPRDEGDYA